MLRSLTKISELQTTEIITKNNHNFTKKSLNNTKSNDIIKDNNNIYNNIKYLYKYNIFTITSVTCVTQFFPDLDIKKFFNIREGIISRLQKLHFQVTRRSTYDFNELYKSAKKFVTCVTLKQDLNQIIELIQRVKKNKKTTIKSISYKKCNLCFWFYNKINKLMGYTNMIIGIIINKKSHDFYELTKRRNHGG